MPHFYRVLLVTSALLLGATLSAYAVPNFNFDISGTDLLLFFLGLVLGVLDIPAAIGLVVRWLLLQAEPTYGVTRTLILFWASLAWGLTLVLPLLLRWNVGGLVPTLLLAVLTTLGTTLVAYYAGRRLWPTRQQPESTSPQ